MNMNMTKTDVQALNGAAKHVISSLFGFYFDTVDPITGPPREIYKYLGFFLSLRTTPRSCSPSPNEKCPRFSSDLIPSPHPCLSWFPW